MRKILYNIDLKSTPNWLSSRSPLNFTTVMGDAIITTYDSTDITEIIDNLVRIIKGGKHAIVLEVYNETLDELEYELLVNVIGGKFAIIAKSKVAISDDLKDLAYGIESYRTELMSAATTSTFAKSSLAGSDVEELSEEEEVVAMINTQTQGTVSKPKYNLSDYKASKLLTDELQEICDFFENFDDYRKIGINIPKGVLFKGPPGTGKTYAAQCIAGQASAYFISTTASALQGMYVGSGAKNIKDLFMGARNLARVSKKGVIIFIDELDSLGNRESGHEESTRTLNQLLAEMSGFNEDENIMLMGATNFSSRLDAALTRSGRFSRQIYINRPKLVERLSMIEYYFNKIKMPLLCTHAEIAAITGNCVAADIKEIANEASILQVRAKKSEIDINAVSEALNRVITKATRSEDYKSDTLDLVTAHEVGHVVANYFYAGEVASKVTNLNYGGTGGFMQHADKDTTIPTQADLMDEVRVCLAGRAAEIVVCGYATVGASSDLDKAKSILKDYYNVYNFEVFDVKDENLINNKIAELLKEIEKHFSQPEVKAIIDNIIKELTIRRTLYTADLLALLTGAPVIKEPEEVVSEVVEELELETEKVEVMETEDDDDDIDMSDFDISNIM